MLGVAGCRDSAEHTGMKTGSGAAPPALLSSAGRRVEDGHALTPSIPETPRPQRNNEQPSSCRCCC